MNAGTHKQLLQAVREGDVETAESLINEIGSSELRKFYDRKNIHDSLLHVAAKNGQNDIIKLLVHHLDVNSLTISNKTALWLAIEENHHETVELLFNFGADISIPRESVYTALFRNACASGRREIIKILLEQGFHIYSIEELNPPLRTIVSSSSQWKQSLEYIILDNCLEIIKMILSREEDQFIVLTTAVKVAVQRNNVEKNKDFEVIALLETILSYARDCERGSMCLKGLFYSVDSGSIPIVQFFLNQGANINYCDRYHSVLTHAILKRSDEIVRFLLDKGANCNVISSAGECPLIFTLKFGLRETLETLLEYGECDININWEEFLDNNYYTIGDSIFFKNFTVAMTQVEVLIKHTVKLQEGRMFVPTVLLRWIDNEKAPFIPFKEKCKEEIKLMKKQKIDDFCKTLFELWITNLVQLTGYLKNKNVKDFVTSEEFKIKFPIYSSSMHLRFQKGFQRIYLLKRVCNFFLSLSTREEHRLPKLPATCVNEIFNFLNDKDLISLRGAYY